ncbi:MAG: glycosyltransferase, partial [Rhodothermia bacterium]
TAALTGRLEQAEEQRVEAHAQILQQTERETEHRILITSLEDQIKDIAEDREGVVARYERLNADHEEILAELHSIHGSRLWKIASLYWRVLEKMGRMPVTAEKQQGGNLPVERASSTSRPTSSTRDAVATGLPVAAVDRENTHDVLCLPIIDWEFRFQRPQQLMSRFAENGNRVYYLAQAFRKGGAPFVIDEKRKNVFEIGLRGRKLDVYGDVLDDGAVDELVQSIEALRIEEGIRAAAMIVQLPFWWPLAERLRSDLGWPIVYDCMDFHGGFSTNKAGMLDQERELLQRADLVVVSSSMLESEAKTFCSDPLMVRNGCDFDNFATVGVRQPGERLVVGYFGAIADWFDSDLVADLAERRPDWSFVLVGSTFTAETARLKKLSNVTMPGEQPYDSIPSWVDGFDVLILPFKRVPLTEATNPVKAYEILATGKPLISVPIPEIIPLAPLVRLASDAVEFEREILASITNNDLDQVEARRSFARENTWQRRFEVFGPAVFRAFPKATIIVVTYKKEELTEACLESIRAHTLWPNYEVIVVDNASDDGTPELLQEFARSVPNIRVILNDKNLGFAAANNQGLRIAEGQFLILLNNDTVVTRGWLSGLIRHLVKNPGTGILGPVTNEIGNEAKIEVGYSNLEEMPAWADEHTRKNYEVFFSIPVLAMFCLAMRRETFETVGLLDERFGVGMFEDDDFSGRVRQAGYDVVCTEDVFVHHVGRAAFSQMKKDDYDRVFLENRRKYEEKWGNEWVPHKYRDW